MITSIVYILNGEEIEHDGSGIVHSLPIDLDDMNIPEGIDPSTYTISFGTNRNMHEFSSISTILDLITTIIDDDNNTRVIDKSYYGNFEEI